MNIGWMGEWKMDGQTEIEIEMLAAFMAGGVLNGTRMLVLLYFFNH